MLRRAALVVPAAVCLVALPPAALPAHAERAPTYQTGVISGLGQPIVLATPDADGDRRTDLLVRTERQRDGVWTATFTARSGRSGRALWQRTLDKTSGDAFAYPDLRVGPSGAPGVVLTAHSSNPSRADDLELVGLRADGAPLWQRGLSGSTAADGSLVDQPYLGEAVRTGRDDGLLVGSFSYSYDFVTGRRHSTMQPEVVGGADGAVREVGRPVEVDGVVQLFSAPDVDGDGWDEVAFLSRADRGEPDGVQHLLLRDGRTGDDLWTADVPGTQPTITALLAPGDVDGDDAPDVVVQQSQTEDGYSATLVSGATGRVRWTRPGSAVALGGEAVGVVAGGTLTAVRADGSVLWRREGTAAPYGDIGRPTPGVGFAQVLAPPRGPAQVISGRDGSTLWSGLGDGDVALGVPLDGAGDDLVRVARVGDGLRITGIRGDTGRRLWARRLPGHVDDPVAAVDVDGSVSPRAEVVVRDVSAGRLRMLDGVTGRLRWTLVLATGRVIRG